MRPPRRLAAGLCIAASLLCAAPVFCQPRATTTGPDGLRIPHARPEPSSDEAGLWDATARAERSAKASGEVNADLALNAYVRHLICKLAPDYGDDLRALVMNRPFLNASAAPNGYVEVYTGLLLRTENEDQLAFVLGHEITHFARNHSLKAWRHTRNAMNGALLLSTGVALAAGAASHSAAGNGGAGAARTVNTISSTARDLNNLVYLNAIASIFAFDRDDESEADRLGYARAMRAGYRGAAAIDMWNEVLDEARASEFEAVRHGDSRASIFDTHPLTTERISALKKTRPRRSGRRP